MAKLAIIGAGAIGGSVAALLHRAGHQVTLIVRPGQVEACAAGLHITGVMGEWRAALPVASSLADRPDLVLLAVKSHQVLEAVEQHRAQLADLPLVTMQNGVRSTDLVAQLLPPAQLISAVVFIIATSLTPGVITIAAPGSLVVGRPFAPEQTVEPVVRILHDAVPTTTARHIQRAQWLKLIVNLNNAVPALVNQSFQDAAGDPFLGRVMIALMREGMATVRRAGLKLESIPGAPLGLIHLFTRLPTGLAGALIQRRLRQTSPVEILGSTLQSLRRGQPTEIAFLNGEIVRLGEQVGWPTPLNAAVVALVHAIEQGGPFLTSPALRERLGTLVA